MKIISYKNPRWSNEQNTAFDCIVVFEELGEVVFTVDKSDNYDHSKQLWEMVTKEIDKIEKYVAPQKTPTVDRRPFNSMPVTVL